jgi:quercetin dioxygenase-like cupin family protein
MSNQPSEANVIIDDIGHEIPDILDASIVSKTLYLDSDVRAVLFAFADGQSLSEHTSGHPAILHFLEGSADVTLGTKTMSAGPGSWVHMPAHLPHSIEARTPVRMLLLILT